ncbi:hypothetical protein ECZU12_54240 [Escherichia coli]|nr:hypothetical protein ECZU12_54240 [Escherichia coli]
MNLPQDGIKLHRGNFTAIGQQIQPYLEEGKCFRMVLKPWREKRSLLPATTCGTAKSVNTSSAGVKRSPLQLG